jgi:hypothetical protein
MARPSIVPGSAQSSLRAAFLALSVLAMTAGGHAQAPATGTLSGRVVDSGDLPLAGTIVTITSPVIQSARRFAVTDAGGRYQFPQVPAGTYEVTFALQGFEQLVVGSVAIPAGAHMGLTPSMTPGSIEKRQAVTGGAVTIANADAGAARPDQNGAPVASDNRDRDVPPQRLVTVLPRYPRDAARGTAGTVSVMFTLDASGRPFNVQPAPEHDIIGLRDLDGVLTAAPEPGQDFRAAAVDAVSQWVYATPRQGDITLLVQFSFLAEGRVRLGTQHVVEPVAPRLEPLISVPLGTAR